MVAQSSHKIILITLLLLFNCFAKSNLDDFINNDNLFKLDIKSISKDFLTRYKYKWNNVSKTSMRSYRTTNYYLSHAVYESVINFEEENLNDIELYYYSRGENGVISDESYNSLIDSLQTKIKKTLVVIKSKNQKEKGLETYTWTTKNKQYVLVAKKTLISPRLWNYQYVKLNIFKTGTKQRIKKYNFDVKSNITKIKNGDIYLKNVPMVDQGAKGYCACATAARVLQYFGREGDQYQMADLMDTSAGTSPDKLEEALRAISRDKKLRLQKINIVPFPIFETKNLNKFLKSYNRKFKRNQINFNGSNYKEIFIHFGNNEEAFIDTRVKMGRGNFKSFIKSIESNINKATPLSWTVFLGFVTEKKLSPQTFGGHMRLIIGYNPITENIIYTDSWGEGHELKRLSYKGAYAMTAGLYILSL